MNLCGADNRNGLFWCYKHKDWKPNECSQIDFATLFFDKVYSKVLLLKPTKVRESKVRHLAVWREGETSSHLLTSHCMLLDAADKIPPSFIL